MLAPPSSLIQAEHVSKEFDNGESKITILNDINLSIISGTSIAIVGVSGSGKTTLLTLLAGIDLATSGMILFENTPYEKMSDDQRTETRQHNMGFIFQTFRLLPRLTALENVMLPLEIKYEAPKIAQEKAKEALVLVGLEGRLQHYPNQLSGGEQQRVAIARAFITQPKIIFADEITGSLDPKTGNKIINILFELNATLNTTLLMVTHDNDLANQCQQQYRLQDGMLFNVA